MRFGSQIRKSKAAIRAVLNQHIRLEKQQLLFGRLLSEAVRYKTEVSALQEVEFKVFSQWGDDGIIQWLVNRLDIPVERFVEFGVEDYRESNTRFLMMNNNWSGLVMDGSQKQVDEIISSEYYWKYDLTARCAFIDKRNINGLLSGIAGEIGLLHIDLDGNDYWIWREIDVISPVILVLEYNSVFGKDKAISVPYDESFRRTAAHYSGLYFGASIRALHQLSESKGYTFIGCNGAGNNAYFIRNDKLGGGVRKVSLEEGYVESKFRESRSPEGELTYLSGTERAKLIRGLPVHNVESNQIEEF